MSIMNCWYPNMTQEVHDTIIKKDLRGLLTLKLKLSSKNGFPPNSEIDIEAEVQIIDKVVKEDMKKDSSCINIYLPNSYENMEGDNKKMLENHYDPKLMFNFKKNFATVDVRTGGILNLKYDKDRDIFYRKNKVKYNSCGRFGYFIVLSKNINESCSELIENKIAISDYSVVVNNRSNNIMIGLTITVLFLAVLQLITLFL